ncbi:MAG: tyrosine-protein phosphatase [Mesorhizobium sp.]|uniref:tyrosine-protein phosphatase n=2 Tax=unclassified Mesorhizobium TaxID=325217 RepID=UPI001AC5C02C|nr:tyrosine-protein phosphatase [Mesorhizobium sp.]MBN9218358.1 tyrosine-protein phosphatase [Mesorhizobium sp.]
MKPNFSRPKSLWRRAAKTLVGSAIGIAAGMALWAGYLQLTRNNHEVEPGVLYRSAQLAPEQLDSVIQGRRIRTVINLRGAFPGKLWYEAEVAAVRDAGAQFISLTMSANHQPDAVLLASLEQALRTAPRPILIHCNYGADRTGLASALFELLEEGKPAAEAHAQLSFRYGHFPWLTSRTGAMDQTFQQVVEINHGSGPLRVSTDAQAK